MNAFYIHSNAIGFFMLSVIFFTIFNYIYQRDPYDVTAHNWGHFLVARLLYSLFTLISECCLAYIFWQLGASPQAVKFTTGSEIETELLDSQQDFVNEVRVERFDTEAEEQARLWNQFV
jgi:hypothetical protein